MAFKSVGGGGQGGSKKYIKYAECEDGQVLVVGTFLGTSEGRYGPQHEFKLDDDTVQVLNSAGQLNYLIDNFVSPMDRVQVTYVGKEELPSGKYKGKSVHQFDVQVDDGTTAEAKPKAKLAAAAASKPAPKATTKKPKVVKAGEDFEL